MSARSILTNFQKKFMPNLHRLGIFQSKITFDFRKIFQKRKVARIGDY